MKKYDYTTLIKIIEKYGSPCYVFDEKAFILNYRHFLSIMQSQYKKYTIAYSYKTNYAPKFCELVKENGGYAEVVSDMEYEIAKRVGYKNNKIIYNGPFKGPLLEEHLFNQGIVNVDNLDELYRIGNFVSTYKDKVFKIGIRVNINVGQKFISRFGIDADSEDLDNAVKYIKSQKNLKLVGLHCHIGMNRSLEAWKNRTIIMLSLLDKYIDGVPEYIDLGSGMFGNMDQQMKCQFSNNIPTYEDYANVTAKIVNEHYRAVSDDLKPILFTEPGTTLDNNYMDLISNITAIKTIKNKTFAVLNCSMHNLGDVCRNILLPIKVVHNNNENLKCYTNLDFVGYTCLEDDITYPNFSGEIKLGDFVIFGNVGGYSNVDKPPFILPQCAMIGLRDNGETYIIKRRETTDDILSTYVVKGE